MTGAYRYTTVDCVRVWRWFPRVGPAEMVHGMQSCARTLTLAAPLVTPIAPAVLQFSMTAGASAAARHATAAAVARWAVVTQAVGTMPAFELARGGSASPASAAPLPRLSARERGEQPALAPQMEGRGVSRPSGPAAFVRPVYPDTGRTVYPAGAVALDKAPVLPGSQVPSFDIPAAAPVLPAPPTKVPEPATLALLGMALVVLALLDRTGR